MAFWCELEESAAEDFSKNTSKNTMDSARVLSLKLALIVVCGLSSKLNIFCPVVVYNYCSPMPFAVCTVTTAPAHWGSEFCRGREHREKACRPSMRHGPLSTPCVITETWASRELLMRKRLDDGHYAATADSYAGLSATHLHPHPPTPPHTHMQVDCQARFPL